MLVGSEELFEFFADPRDGGGKNQEREDTADVVANDVQLAVIMLPHSESLIKGVSGMRRSFRPAHSLGTSKTSFNFSGPLIPLPTIPAM